MYLTQTPRYCEDITPEEKDMMICYMSVPVNNLVNLGETVNRSQCRDICSPPRTQVAECSYHKMLARAEYPYPSV